MCQPTRVINFNRPGEVGIYSGAGRSPQRAILIVEDRKPGEPNDPGDYRGGETLPPGRRLTPNETDRIVIYTPNILEYLLQVIEGSVRVGVVSLRDRRFGLLQLFWPPGLTYREAFDHVVRATVAHEVGHALRVIHYVPFLDGLDLGCPIGRFALLDNGQVAFFHWGPCGLAPVYWGGRFQPARNPLSVMVSDMLMPLIMDHRPTAYDAKDRAQMRLHRKHN
jgi:hypothetical protein